MKKVDFNKPLVDNEFGIAAERVYVLFGEDFPNVCVIHSPVEDFIDQYDDYGRSRSERRTVKNSKNLPPWREMEALRWWLEPLAMLAYMHGAVEGVRIILTVTGNGGYIDMAMCDLPMSKLKSFAATVAGEVRRSPGPKLRRNGIRHYLCGSHGSVNLEFSLKEKFSDEFTYFYDDVPKT